jgi:glycosyltransferase involved in cell wall biosynthesis
MIIAHLMASPFFGGPERQMLGLARHLPAATTSVFLTFAENGKCQALLDQVHSHGFEGLALQNNTPNVRAAVNEVAGHLRRLRADVLTCSGYKPDLIGWLAARQVGIPVVAVAHGWTAATLKVRLYETVDRLILRWLDAVVCVSEAQGRRVRQAKVPDNKIAVIRNAIDADAFRAPDPKYADLLRRLFKKPPKRIVGAAGRLSPEKGFEQLVDAAGLVLRHDPDIGFIHFGDGPSRAALARRIAGTGLGERFILAGFRADLGHFLPHLDVIALPSFTEGLPVVLLEAFAAGVPAIATAVGGTPEIVEDGRSGYLVPPGDPPAMARRVLDILRAEPNRLAMGQQGRDRVRAQFTFTAQSAQYQRLFHALTRAKYCRALLRASNP